MTESSQEQREGARLLAERKLLKRLIISHQDLDHAKRYADLILKLGLHKSDEEGDRYLHRGLNVALVVSYWRPFSDNEGSADTHPRLPDKFISGYSPTEEALHKEVRNLRNKAFAHSDAEAHGVRIHVREFLGSKTVFPVGWNAHIPLSDERTKQLLGMINKLLARISEEQIRIQRLLPADQYF
jgi:hypothetical protein